MKKLSSTCAFLVVTFLLLGGLPVRADYGEAGCGPGSVIFKKNSFLSQSTAQGVNGILSPFKITSIWSHSSNCSSKWTSYKQEEQERMEFVAANYWVLKNEVATGDGETLTTLAYLHGCGTEQKNLLLIHSKNMVDVDFDPMNIAEESQTLTRVCRLGGGV